MMSQSLQPLLVSRFDVSGGAARATHRLHRALLAAGVDSKLVVSDRRARGPAVEQVSSSVGAWLRPRVENRVQRLQRSDNPSDHSSNILPTAWSRHLRGDVVNLHWVGAGTMSIADIGRIRAPVVMTLHDMWAFCGAEHYAPDAEEARWVAGYQSSNRAHGHRGIDLDRYTWQRKRRHWQPMTVVTPSQWLANCVRRSHLMQRWPVHVVPNPLDTDVFRPRERAAARRALGLPPGKRVVLFGAAVSTTAPRKGFDLLLDALGHLERKSDVLGVVVGEDEPAAVPRTGVALRWMGRITDDDTLATLYSAADVVVVPSRQENLPQTATEAQSCGTPVVGFDTTGLPDAVVHGETGYLAAAFDPAGLAEGIEWVTADAGRNEALGAAARQRAVRRWSHDVVVPAYLDVYRGAIETGGAA